MVSEGFRYLPEWLDAAAQVALLTDLRAVLTEAPFYRPVMPRSGRPLTVQMSNAGSHGWITDRTGYRYERRHPVTGRPWPAIPDRLLDLWHQVGGYGLAPECCLINHYDGTARMGLHQDRDEEDLAAPVVSLSLGDSAVFRLGGPLRKSPTRSMKLHSGDVVVLGGQSRLAFHGIDRVLAGSSRLLGDSGYHDGGQFEGGRINVTLRRVTGSD